ncbi:PfkB family carbohydrate kinase [Ferviditalea candida]|uniref:PfkB family carbohydrate kinase n=1 Tax=Ferviditalea candida TaxID=3108399 RepID=A0ABU5ZCV5_9BACL|nr:PfkB family carbohydrate kinase [Paenibacillaceae bacterium T2]
MNSIMVTGTVFVDCKGFSALPYDPHGRNLGRIEFVHGGVGRNVAENLSNLGLPVKFVSTVDTSAIGREVVSRLRHSRVDTTALFESEPNGMGMWLAILNEEGNLAGSISQMPELGFLENKLRDHGAEWVRESEQLVLELDLSDAISETIIELSKRYAKPVYGIPGNLDVILRNRHLLAELQCFICNEVEAEKIMEVSLNHQTPQQIAEQLKLYAHSIGIPSMVITLGENGSVYYDSNTGCTGYQPVVPVRLVDSSGAGDAFFSGTVAGLIRKLSLEDAVKLGTRVAAWTIESSENTCRDLSSKFNNK